MIEFLWLTIHCSTLVILRVSELANARLLRLVCPILDDFSFGQANTRSNFGPSYPQSAAALTAVALSRVASL
jgi:hypothetical protein